MSRRGIGRSPRGRDCCHCRVDHRPALEFFRRNGALLILLFVLVHKVGDTLGQLTLRLLLNDLAYTNDEIALYDVGIGFWTQLVGILSAHRYSPGSE